MNRPVQGIRARKDGLQRREKILDEALRIIGERGYHGFGLQELAERCGISRPGVLHHFGSKDRLLIELLRYSDARHEQAVLELLGNRQALRANAEEERTILLATVHIIMERNAGQPELLRLQAILQAETINGNHPAHAYFQAREAAKLELMTACIASLSEHPASMARQIVALMDGLQSQWLREGMGFDLVKEVDRAVAAVTR